jgi:hypothetical protein
MEPIRPLGPTGQSTWDRITAASIGWFEHQLDVELLQFLCEQIDERAFLRRNVLNDNDWRDRTALRALDQQILQCLSLLGLTPSDRNKIGLQAANDHEHELATFIASLSSPVRDS